MSSSSLVNCRTSSFMIGMTWLPFPATRLSPSQLAFPRLESQQSSKDAGDGGVVSSSHLHRFSVAFVVVFFLLAFPFFSPFPETPSSRFIEETHLLAGVLIAPRPFFTRSLRSGVTLSPVFLPFFLTLTLLGFELFCFCVSLPDGCASF